MSVFSGQVCVVIAQKGCNKNCTFFIYICLQEKFKTTWIILTWIKCVKYNNMIAYNKYHIIVKWWVSKVACWS
jgi:hypothetical protein